MPFKVRFEFNSNDPAEVFEILEAARDVLHDAARNSRWGYSHFHVLDCDTGLEHHYDYYGDSIRHHTETHMIANFAVRDKLSRECGCKCTIEEREGHDHPFRVRYVALRDGHR